MALTRAIGVFLIAGAVVACAGSDRDTFDQQQPEATEPEAKNPGDGFDNTKPPPAPNVEPVAEVFGHSRDTLYRLDPITKAVTTVGKFDGCLTIIDIALDSDSNLFAVSYDALYKVDRATAKCSELAKGSYPNSLSFVPKGTLDAGSEALVGFEDADYVRIDVTTGAKTKIGTLSSGKLRSSGDIVSAKGGGTYLTVKGAPSCQDHDCLVEIDPKSGKVTKNWGSIEHSDVFGLSFWGGKLYGFNSGGDLFEVTFGTSQLATTLISIPARPQDLSFWGAGSTTSAPLVAAPQ